MKITLLPSSMSASGILPNQYLTTFLVNDHVAIDAGTLGVYGSPAEQAAVRHVFLSHTHIDHWATLPTFLINVFGLADAPVTLHASATALEALRQDVFNGRVWPNLFEMEHAGRRFVNVQPVADGQTVTVEGLRITAVAVDHVVPTLGFLVEDGHAAVVIASDTAPTTAIWQRAERLANLKAVFLEATLPNDMAELAASAKHLTAADFLGEMRKVSRPAKFLAVHLSARTRDQVVAELMAAGVPNLEIARFGTTYEF